jgi:hypothetical protein
MWCSLCRLHEGVRNVAPLREWCLWATRTHQKEIYPLSELAEHEILTFQKGSQPHDAADLFKAKILNPKECTRFRPSRPWSSWC